MSAAKAGLRHEMSFWDLVMASLGGIIGSGWLYGSWKGGFLAGPSAIFAWIIGGICVLLLGLVFAELGGALPEAGGIVRYPHYSHGSFVSFLMSWAAVIAYASVPPIEADAAVQYGAYYVHGLFNTATGNMTTAGTIVALLLMILFFFLNYFGVRLFAKTNTVWTWIKLIVPGITVILLLVTSFHASNLSDAAAGGFAPNGSSAVLQAVPLGGIIFAYLGFRQALDMAGEAKNPQRDVPKAIITAILIGVVLYVLLQLAWVVAMPTHAVSISGKLVNPLAKGWVGTQSVFSSPFAELVGSLGFGWLAAILFADAVWSPTGTGNIYTASTSRVMLAMTRNGYFPKVFGYIHPKSGVPIWALLATVLIGLIFLANYGSWSSLVGLVSSATVFTYIVGPISAAVLRRTAPNLHRPFRLGSMNVIAPIAFVIATLIIYWSGWSTDSVVLLLILFGVLLYAYGASSFLEDTSNFGGKHIKAGIWLVVYMLVMLALTYFGSTNFGAPHQLIPYPWDLVVVILVSLGFFYWGKASGMMTPEAEEANKRTVPAAEATSST